MKDLTPNLAVKDIKESVAFYRDILGFELLMAVPEDKSDFAPVLAEDKKYLYVQMKNGNVELMMQEAESLKEDIGKFFDNLGGSVSLYIKVENIDELYKKISKKVEIVKDLETAWYGMREFYIKDCNGYILGFASERAS
jgi:uncharacterized glyoxalase superfamily protein PhnB